MSVALEFWNTNLRLLSNAGGKAPDQAQQIVNPGGTFDTASALLRRTRRGKVVHSPVLNLCEAQARAGKFATLTSTGASRGELFGSAGQVAELVRFQRLGNRW